MTLRFTITMTGMNRVLGNFKRLEFNLPKQTNKISETIAKRIEKRAKAILIKAPYHRHSPGLIAGTKATKTERKGQWQVISEAFDDYGYDYAPAVEYGTRPHEIPNNPAWGLRGRTHPGAHSTGPKLTKGYFRRAIDQTKQEEKKVAEEGVRRAIIKSGFMR